MVTTACLENSPNKFGTPGNRRLHLVWCLNLLRVFFRVNAVYGYYLENDREMLGENSLQVVVGKLLKQREMTLAVAESCTGGLVGHRITNVPGSSTYYEGSVTAYSYNIKELILHVQHDTLCRYGAVSEQVAREMAVGVRRAFQADIGLAVTGIAGPGGGTPEKPVGLVYIALAAPDGEWVERCMWHGGRLENKERSAEAVLDLLHRYLEKRL